MPIYEYKCSKCEHQFEVIQRFSDNPVESCPECNKKSVQKLVSAPSFRLGVGVSGPQVVEGWHGVAYGKPLKKTREYVQILRDILNRDGKTSFEGEYYNLPYKGPDASGLGKPLKLIEEPLRKDIPIYLAATRN